MTLTDLRYLVNLDKDRHFGKAAERSFVSQPTLSLAIKKLEDSLGVLLFERTRNEVKPTDAGARLIRQAERVLQEAARLEQMAREGQDELDGPLRLGVIYTIAPYLLPGLIPTLRAKAARMPLVLEENFTARLLDELRAGNLDAAVLALPVDLTGLAAWPLYDESFLAVVPTDHPWAALDALAADRLADEPLMLLGPGHCFREQVVSACPRCAGQEGAQPRVGSSLETIRYMVASGLGVTVLPESATAQAAAMQGLVAVPLNPSPQREVVLLFRRGFPRMDALRVLRDAILACGIAGVRLRLPEPPSAS